MKKNLRLLITLIIFFFIGISNSFSANYISISDTTLIHNGTSSKIPVYSNMNFTNIKNAKFIFKFNSLLLNIKGIYSEPENACKETGTSFNTNLSNLTESYLEVTTTEFNISNNGTLFNIELETLAGPDSIAILSPSEIIINDVPDNSVELNAGKIKIGLPVYPIINEGIQEVYPNPFSFNGTVTFSVKDDSKIKFYIYSSNGRLIAAIPGATALKYWFYDKTNKLIPNMENYTFTRGYYKFIFEIVDWKFSSGTYFLVMETVRGKYETKLLLLK